MVTRVEAADGGRASLSWRIFKFLASLPLAVILITTLASVLLAATFYESDYGTTAVQARVYQAWWFPWLLAALAVNIFCAAAIRFPWKRYQTGFVITHGGLLTILLGCWFTLRYTVDGNVAMTEGGQATSTILLHQSGIRVTSRQLETNGDIRKHDTLIPTELEGPSYPSFLHYMARFPFALPRFLASSFYGDAIPRGFERVFLSGLMDKILAPTPEGFHWPKGKIVEEEIDDPAYHKVRVEILEYLASSKPVEQYRPARAEGFPALDFSLYGKPPRVESAEDMEMLSGWLYQDDLKNLRKDSFGNLADATFWSVGHAAEVRDFLKPPTGGLGPLGKVAVYDGDRAFYVDVTEQPGATTLDNGRITVELSKFLRSATVKQTEHGRDLVDDPRGPLNPAVLLAVKTPDGAVEQHVAFAMLPYFPTRRSEMGHPASEPAGLSVRYLHPAYFASPPEGRWGSLQFVQGPDEKLYYRLLGAQGLEGAGEVALEQSVPLADRNLKKFVVRKHLPHAVHEIVYERLDLPRDQRDKAIPAAHLRITAGGQTAEVWLARNDGAGNVFASSDKVLQVAFEQLAKPMDGYSLSLRKFIHDTDPGTDKSAGFTSIVRLQDSQKNVDRKEVISMNEPFTYGGWTLPIPVSPTYRPNLGGTTFYQASFNPPDEDGRYVSILSVMHDPGRPLKYFGSLMLVLGIATMFWMKAYFFKPRHGGQAARQVAEKRRLAASLGAAAPTGSRPASPFGSAGGPGANSKPSLVPSPQPADSEMRA